MRVDRSSWSLSLVWWPNWLQGKASTTRESPNVSVRAFNCSKSLTVVPQRDATFWIMITLPL